jgi:hypothetical protein
LPETYSFISRDYIERVALQSAILTISLARQSAIAGPERLVQTQATCSGNSQIPARDVTDQKP